VVGGEPERVPNAEVTCPWCGSADCCQVSAFGQTLMTSQYFCRQCRSSFERARWLPEPSDRIREAGS
jgi:transposase-like protein